MERMTTRQSMELARMLTDKPMTYDELELFSGVSKTRLARWVKANRRDLFVAGYAPDKRGRPFIPMWQWGVGVDARRPGPVMTSAERMRALRAMRKGAQ